MHVLLAVFFLVSSMVKVHGKHPVRCVVVFLIGLHASARMTACCACPGVGFIVIPFFVFCACKTSPGQAIVALLLWQKRRADQDSFFLAPLIEAACMCRWNSLDLTAPK